MSKKNPTMSDFDIKILTSNNADKVYKIYKEVLATPLEKSEFVTRYNETVGSGKNVFVKAEFYGATIGVLNSRIENDLIHGKYAVLIDIAVLEKYRNYGCAKAMLRYLENVSVSLLCGLLRCYVEKENDVVESLLLSMGYNDLGRGLFEKILN